MPFEFIPQPIAGVVTIRPRVFRDTRGCFFESYKTSEFHAAGIEARFVQDNDSVSTRGVLRGIHYQIAPHAQGKLVGVVQGTVWDVCVDLRRGSPTFGRWFGTTLSDENRTMVFVPPGCGHGFLVLSETAHFHYKCTQEYVPEAERGVRWDDATLAIAWPLNDVVVSAKDAALPPLSAAPLYDGPPA